MAKPVTKKNKVNNLATQPKLEFQAVKSEKGRSVATLEATPSVVEPEVSVETMETEVIVQTIEPQAQESEPHEDQSIHVWDLAWGGWFHSVKLGQAYQKELENMAYQLIDQQKNSWVQTKESFEKVENDIQRTVDQAKTYVFQNLNYMTWGSASLQVDEWRRQAEGIADSLKQVNGTTSKAAFHLVDQSIEEVEAMLKTFIKQQENQQIHIQSLLETFINQAKATNKVFLPAW